MWVLDRITGWLNQALAFVAGVALVSMVLLTCGNIILREVWFPIRGTFELLGLFGAVATTFALGYTQKHRMHIAVTIVVDSFSTTTKKVLTVINGLMSMAFFILAGWQISVWSNVLMEEGEVTETLQIIFYPFTYATALGCLVLALVFLTEVLHIFIPRPEADK